MTKQIEEMKPFWAENPGEQTENFQKKLLTHYQNLQEQEQGFQGKVVGLEQQIDKIKGRLNV